MSKTLTQRAADKQFHLHKSAYSRGLEFDLNLQDVKALLTRKKCFYTGVVLTTPDSTGRQRQTDRTIDRIDSNKGYLKGNVVACAAFANQMKERWIEGNDAFGIEALKMFTQKMNGG